MATPLAVRADPYGSNIFVQPLEVSKYIIRGFDVPDTVSQWIPPTQGLCIKVGPRVSGVRQGDVVLHGLGVGTLLEPGLLVINEKDVICRK